MNIDLKIKQAKKETSGKRQIMRDYLFRGKRKDNGEWVHGYYTELPVGSLGATIFSNDDEIVCEDITSYIIKVFEKQHSNYSNGNPLLVIECENYEVIPETVGQYTGLTDKNGTKIFKGDIVQYLTYDDFDCQSVVKFGEYKQDGSNGEYGARICLGFYVEVDNFTCPDWCENEPECFSDYQKQQNILEIANECEVIGNIYDNPELLEGDKDNG